MVAFKYKNGSSWTNLVLPVGNGGTGRTNGTTTLFNLESATAVNPFSDNPRPGRTGTLQPTNGGTGKTTLSDIATAIKGYL